MTKRFSRKRQAIIDCLKDTKSHPTAQWVYEKLKPQFPDLSLATVYRNLNELKKSGEIAMVATVLDKERFDYTTSLHVHAICRECGKITDVDGITLPEELADASKEIADFTVTNTTLQFVGICDECKKKQK